METSERARYRIKVRGILSPGWSTWFDDIRVVHEGTEETTLIGEIADQAALHGLLSRIRDFGLTLIALERCEPDSFVRDE
jgi:hypothetical protein